LYVGCDIAATVGDCGALARGWSCKNASFLACLTNGDTDQTSDLPAGTLVFASTQVILAVNAHVFVFFDGAGLCALICATWTFKKQVEAGTLGGTLVLRFALARGLDPNAHFRFRVPWLTLHGLAAVFAQSLKAVFRRNSEALDGVASVVVVPQGTVGAQPLPDADARVFGPIKAHILAGILVLGNTDGTACILAGTHLILGTHDPSTRLNTLSWHDCGVGRVIDLGNRYNLRDLAAIGKTLIHESIVNQASLEAHGIPVEVAVAVVLVGGLGKIRGEIRHECSERETSLKGNVVAVPRGNTKKLHFVLIRRDTVSAVAQGIVRKACSHGKTRVGEVPLEHSSLAANPSAFSRIIH
jgi:hypothetical protein